ncbi:MAG TPA: TetR/AcrR family transcriptional regulator [Nitrososphaera sp.]|nr:TetR/AcrR family transcriptional regulator [Nitrososphaera sp.]
MSKGTEEKSERILKASLALLAKKGYENTTINDIADSADVSRGLLHYYFKDKEDLVSKALTFGFSSMWESSIGALSAARSTQELTDSMIEVLKRNTQQNPDFSALLFEMWVSGRRSDKIRKVFSDGLNETIDRLKKLMELASNTGVIKINTADAEGIVRILLAMYHGLAIQLLTNPEKIKDKKLWTPVRRLLLMAFGDAK